jgi:hypothetical protein
MGNEDGALREGTLRSRLLIHGQFHDASETRRVMMHGRAILRTPSRRAAPAVILALLVFAGAPVPAAQARPIKAARVVPTGTRLPIRFLEPITSGRDLAHSEIRAQSLAPLLAGPCVVVPAFTRLAGTIEKSRAGRMALLRGSLRIVFDSIEVAPGRWLALSGVLDSLEWSPRRVKSGTVSSGRRSISLLAAEQLALLAADVAAAPVAGLEAARLTKRPRVLILSGEEAIVRLVDPPVVTSAIPCDSTRAPNESVQLPPLAPHATEQDGTGNGDPVNLVLLGGDANVARAFASADWQLVYRSTFPHLARGVWDALLGHADPRAPVSHAYYGDREEDVAFERASPSARVRHHIRLWKLDPAGPGDTLWAAAASEDVGLVVRPGKAITHRIDARIDLEREVVVRELLAGGCARLDGYSRLPDSAREGVNTHGQHFRSDGLTAVLRVGPCEP